jgi:hypothetical protein
VDAEPLRLSLRCDGLGIALSGTLESAPLGRTLAPGRRLSVPLLHAKRDGQACFAYVDELTGAATPGQPSGRPGEIFAFGGDPSGSGGERRGQLIFVYGPANLFVEPFDRGFHERLYTRAGQIEDVPELARLGEHLWRRGSQQVALELAAT